jgi:hypothetical protein
MITSLNSAAEQPNESLEEMTREAGEDNVRWLKRSLSDLEKGLALVLIGGISRYDLAVRVAQSLVRHDRTPSNWSRVAAFDTPVEKLAKSKDLANALIHEISLDPPAGFGFPPEGNALQTTEVSRYADPAQYPNVAVLAFPGVSWGDLHDALFMFRGQRASVDASALLLRWLGYAWGIGENPLKEGHGVPSAAMVDEVGLVVGLDLTPGLDSRASCPEAIWQAARWWHEYYEEARRAAPSGRWTTPHWLLAPYQASVS